MLITKLLSELKYVVFYLIHKKLNVMVYFCFFINSCNKVSIYLYSLKCKNIEIEHPELNCKYK